MGIPLPSGVCVFHEFLQRVFPESPVELEDDAVGRLPLLPGWLLVFVVEEVHQVWGGGGEDGAVGEQVLLADLRGGKTFCVTRAK